MNGFMIVDFNGYMIQEDMTTAFYYRFSGGCIEYWSKGGVIVRVGLRGNEHKWGEEVMAGVFAVDDIVKWIIDDEGELLEYILGKDI